MLVLVQEISSKVDGIDGKVEKMSREVATHIAEEPALFATAFAKAFPDGDPESHAAYHHEVIAKMHERTEFWKDMRKSLAKWGLFGFAGWAIYALWHAFLQGPRH